MLHDCSDSLDRRSLESLQRVALYWEANENTMCRHLHPIESLNSLKPRRRKSYNFSTDLSGKECAFNDLKYGMSFRDFNWIWPNLSDAFREISDMTDWEWECIHGFEAYWVSPWEDLSLIHI